MKKSKRVISLLLSVIMLLSVFQTGFAAFAADGTQYVLDATEAKQLADAGAVATATQVVRVAKGLYSFEPGSTIVPATPSGIPAMGDRALANAGNVNEEAKYPEVKITFKELPDQVPVISCVNSNSITNNIIMTTAIYDTVEKSYTWTIASGTANAGDTIKFNITYTYEGREYISTAYSYVEGVSQPAGSYVSTETKFRDILGGFRNYYSDVTVATRVLGINTYGSLESFTSSSTDLRGYYDASLNKFVLKSTNDYVMYSATRDDETYDKNELINYLINDRRSYADVYVDTSVTESFADLNLRYAVAKAEQKGGNVTQNLEAIVVQRGKTNVSTGALEGTGDYALGTHASTGIMALGDQYVTTFDGQTFTDGEEYTIITRASSSYNGAVNSTSFPVGLRIHTVNKGELRALINDILHNYTPENPTILATYKGVNPQSWYYSAGFAAYETAMLNAQTVLQNPRSTQEQINNAITSLENAYDGLVLAEADYSKVNDAINEANKIDASLYTDESYADLMQAISVYDEETNPEGKIQKGFSVLFQPQVDEWEAEIKAAIKALDYRLADYEELNGLYSDAQNVIANKHLYEDVIDVERAMDAIDWKVEVTEQQKVDVMADTLREALNRLVYVGADYTAVNEAIESVRQYISSNYTVDSYANLRNVINSIDRTLNVTQQSIVDGYVTQIEQAIAGLVELPADYTELKDLLTQFGSLVEKYYTEETYKVAKAAAEACVGYEEIGITRQEEINAMVLSLKTAINNLEMHDADYSVVDDYIVEFNNMDKSQITQDSINRVNNAINAVNRNLKKDRQNDVDDYALAIRVAIDTIIYNSADYSKVNAAINEANIVDRTLYTAESIAALDAAVARVQKGLGINRQAEVDAMERAIREALGNLTFGPADYSTVEAAINSFKEKDRSHYTPKTVADVQAAIDAVNYELTKKDQHLVTMYAFNIVMAINALEEANADYTELMAIIETKPKDLESQYTSESILVLTSAENAIDWNLKAKDQAKVIGYQKAVAEAIQNLKFLPGDYSDVDRAIAEGLAIIERNDPPISADSINAFKELVASLDRTYTIKQESEIAALAVQIRSAYAQFSYSEAINKASISLVADKSVVCPGDIVTVSVVVGTDYYAASSSIPVVYDRYYYQLIGASVEEAFAFEGSYAASAVTGGNINSPAKGYPASYSELDKDQWRYALVTFRTDSDINETAQILDPEQTVVTLKFKVLDSFTVGNNKARIWVDEAFLKTQENKTGKLFIGRYETSVVNNNVITVGQSIDLSKAIIDLSIKDPDEGASYTELMIALRQKPQYDKSFYTTDSYNAYEKAYNDGNEIYLTPGYTVKEQYIIDNAAKAINDAYNALKLLSADTTRLEEALELIPELPLKPGTATGERFENLADVYTADSLSAYNNAYSVGQAILNEEGLTVVDNQRIQSAAVNIENAYKNLKYHPFKWTDDMEKALVLAPEYPQDFYTTDSYEKFEDAHAKLEAFKASSPSFLNNDDGLRLILALEQAYDGLTLASADLTELQEAINTPLDYDSSFYTDETYGEYQSAVAVGNALIYSVTPLTKLEQGRVDNARDAILSAIESLGFKPFSYEEDVDFALNNWFYDGMEEDYTQESLDNFWNAYIELEDFYYSGEKDIRDDAEALRLMENLRYALDNMELDLPFSKLPDLNAAIEIKAEYDAEVYEENAYAEYEEALKAIEDMIADAEAEKLTVADDAKALEAIERYNAALENLNNNILDADYSEVDRLIEEAQEYINNESIYDNVEDLKTAINAVVPGLKVYDQDTVDGYETAISEALKNVKVKPGDYTRVDDAIKAAKERVAELEATGVDIIPETLDALNKALAAVEEGLDITQQDVIDGYAIAIEEATAALDNVSTIFIIEGSGLYFEEDSVYGYTYLRGFDRIMGVSKESVIRDCLGKTGRNTEIVIVPNVDKLGTECYGTGTLVQHYDDGELIKEYFVVVDGDVDGDGFATTIDITILSTHINEFTEPGLDLETFENKTPWFMAAVDLCRDWSLDVIDLTILISIVNMDDYV